ncbi:MAG: phosphatidylglycerophosphatase A [Acidobacteria bacterium]|nr:phosphatidylglycerophosphatase A [Acidobacteriota bacterium]MBU1474768.1 phosphatidylglycerophosphatase A [Acidobacteriota bacterium]MBU4329578.1 phosphatidylglycerophosphatase A [Acidobacteriota bacterium]
MNTIARMIATFFGLGYAPIAPGTAVSLVVILLYRFALNGLNRPVYIGILAAVFLAGVWASSRHAAVLDQKDPPEIVIDEVAGQMIPLFLLKPDWGLLIAAFLLFRAFDIFKPFPVNRAENYPGGWGIMLDDIAAGLYTGILINLYLIIF